MAYMVGALLSVQFCWLSECVIFHIFLDSLHSTFQAVGNDGCVWHLLGSDATFENKVSLDKPVSHFLVLFP